MSDSPMRWTIISDGDSRRYLCPVDLADEAEAALEASVAYWEAGDYSSPCPEEPVGIIRLEGERLTFTSPELDGHALEVRR